jgi:hypothetical protein
MRPMRKRPDRGQQCSAERRDERNLAIEARLRKIDAAVKEYYDAATEEELNEQRTWAEGVGQSIFVDVRQ